jgi:hypothetical protein
MRIETKYVFQLSLYSPTDIPFVIAALEGAARDWAQTSNEAEPLLELRDQIKAQALEAGLPVTR